MRPLYQNRVFWLCLSAAFILDRAVKLLPDAPRILIPGVVAYAPTVNTGMALGLFQDSTTFLIIATALIFLLAAFLLRSYAPRGLSAPALGLIAGGALGNLLDRVLYGHVLDHFELLFMNFYIFNVADVCVTVGAVLLCASVLFRPEDWPKR